MSDAPVWSRGVDEGGPGALEWWRVVAVEGTCGSRLMFVNGRLADTFARLLIAECCESVLVEHWRDGEQVDARLMVSRSTQN